MSKIKKQLLAGPYLIWIIGFIILPLFMIVNYAFKSSDGGFTFEYVAAIAQHTNIKALPCFQVPSAQSALQEAS